MRYTITTGTALHGSCKTLAEAIEVARRQASLRWLDAVVWVAKTNEVAAIVQCGGSVLAVLPEVYELLEGEMEEVGGGYFTDDMPDAMIDLNAVAPPAHVRPVWFLDPPASGAVESDIPW